MRRKVTEKHLFQKKTGRFAPALASNEGEKGYSAKSLHVSKRIGGVDRP